MNRITFRYIDFPTFHKESMRFHTLESAFKHYGFKTHEREFRPFTFNTSSMAGTFVDSLSEEEYTWFVLRWS